MLRPVELDFYLFVNVREENNPIDFTKEKPQIDFINGRKVDLLSESIEPHFYEVRVIGSFYNEMDFRLFPFEQLKLSIEIEPNTPLDVNQLQLRFDPETGIDEVAKVPGWQIGEYSISSENHDYGNDEIYSRVIMDIIVERSFVGSTVKNLFPIIMITSLSLLIFWIPENFTPRIYLTAPLLLSLVYLHQGALDEIPPVGYMTIFDKIMIINYTLFLNAISSLAIQMRFHITHKDDRKVTQVNRIMRYFIPIIIVGGLAILIPL